MQLNSLEDYYIMEPLELASNNCVIFDFDGTLIANANNQAFYMDEKDENNFVLYAGVKEVLDELIELNVQIVIISNQSKINDCKLRQFEIFNSLFDDKILILIAHKKNEYRKPDIGFLNVIKEKINSDDLEISFMCGDAANQDHEFPPYTWDKNEVDYMFAKNLKVDFYVPNEVFECNFDTYVPTEQLIIMVGNPGSGKSSVSKRLEMENGYNRFSQDELALGLVPNMSKKLNSVKNKKIFTDLLNKGEHVILDACHSSEKLKRVWIDFANSLNIKYVFLWCVRDGTHFNDLRDKPITSRAYPMYTKHFSRPDNEHTVVIS